MDEIRSWLFIGAYRDTLNKNYLGFKSIQAMLQLAEKIEHPNIFSLYLAVEDFAPIPRHLITQGVEFITENRKHGKRILVACGAGINRSSAFCAAALKEEEGLSLFEAFKEVKRKHPDSMPHEPVWRSVCEYYNEAIPYLDIMRLSIQKF
jgi:hypothetical protein